MTSRALIPLVWLGLAACSAPAASDRIVLERVPGGGLTPQAVADADGVVHVVSIDGDPRRGDVFYVRRMPDGAYSQRLRVNSQPGSAVAAGSIRGPQIALGRSGRVHVVWNGSEVAQSPRQTGLPPLYSRLNDAGTAFEPQRNLAAGPSGTDGGATVAAGANGRVFVAWHSDPEGLGDAHRSVFVTRSDDDGAQFEPERPAGGDGLGACACCSMRALVDRSGRLRLLYRAAGDNVNRDMILASSSDQGSTFEFHRLDPWRIDACPLSSAALAEGPAGVVVGAWETRGQIAFARLSAPIGPNGPIDHPPGTARRKHPVVAFNTRGELLLAWVENTGWNRGGSVAWQLYDGDGRATSVRGSAPGVPAWGLAAAAALPDDRFLVLY